MPKEETKSIPLNATDNYDYGNVECQGHTLEVTTLVKQTLFADRETPEEVMKWANSVDIYALTAAAMMWITLANMYVMIPKEDIKNARRFPKTKS